MTCVVLDLQQYQWNVISFDSWWLKWLPSQAPKISKKLPGTQLELLWNISPPDSLYFTSPSRFMVVVLLQIKKDGTQLNPTHTLEQRSNLKVGRHGGVFSPIAAKLLWNRPLPLGAPISWMFFLMKNPIFWKWMRSGGTPILGNLCLDYLGMDQTDWCPSLKDDFMV